MANSVVENVAQKIIAGSVAHLRKQHALTPRVNMDFDNQPANQGQSVPIVVPGKGSGRQVTPGQTPTAANAISHGSETVNLSYWQEFPFELDDKAQTGDWQGLIPASAESQLNAMLDFVNGTIHEEAYTRFYNQVGTAGSAPFTGNDDLLFDAEKLLNDNEAPTQNRFAITSTRETRDLKKLDTFRSAEYRGDEGIAFREGSMGRVNGVDFAMDQQVKDHTAGTGLTGDPTASAASEGATSVTITCDADDTVDLKEGDIISFGSHAYDYTVAADLNIGNSASGTLQLGRPLEAALGGGNNLTEVVVDDHKANLMAHRDAIAFVSRPLQNSMNGADFSETVTDPVTGITFRLEGYGGYKQMFWVYDILFGVGVPRPELGVRMLG